MYNNKKGVGEKKIPKNSKKKFKKKFKFYLIKKEEKNHPI